LTKPIEFAELLARVRVMVRLQQSRRSLHESTQRISVLLHITQTLSSSLDTAAVLHQMVGQVADSVGATRASIILINQDTPLYASSTTEGYDSETIGRILRDGVAGWVIRSMKPLTLGDANRDHRWALLGRIHESTRSVLAVPIIHDKVALGAITVVHTRPHYFTADHVDLLESVAAQSAVAFIHGQLFRLTAEQKQQLERRSHMLEEMLNVGERLRLNLPLPALLDEIASAIYRSLGFRNVVIQVLKTAGSTEAQGVAGRSREAALWTAATVSANVLPLMRERFRISRSYFIPSGYTLDAAQMPAASTPAWMLENHLFVPIGTHTNLLGVIAVDAPPEGSPDLPTIQALEVFANQVATAVQNNRLFSREKDRANQLQLLVDIGRSMTELMTPDQLLRLVASLIQHSFGFRSVAILQVRRGEFVLRAAAVASGQPPPLGQALPATPRLAEAVLSTALSRRENTPDFCLDYAWIGHPINVEIALPLRTHNDAAGILLIAHDQAGGLDAGLESLLTAVAAQLVVALENAQLFAREQARVQQLSRINALSARLTAAQHVEAHFAAVLADIASIFDSPRAALVMFDGEQGSQIAATLNTSPAEAAPPAELLDALGDDLPQLVAPAEQPANAVARLAGALGMDAGIAVQLPTRDQVAGLLLIEPPQGGEPWRTSERSLVQTVANLLAQAIENSQLQHQRMQRLRDDMIRYMAPQLVDQLLSEGGFGAAAEREVVVIFADLRGFTSLAEGLMPRIVIDHVLNRFFALMTEVLYAHEASIDKFLGDGLMAVFGSVLPRPDDVQRALAAAVAMQRAFVRLRADWNRDLGRDIGLGIGMSWGPAVVGNIGSPQRMDYTLIGDVVNTASRLADLAAGSQIVVSQHLVDWLSDDERRQLIELPPVTLKGKVERLAIYEVVYGADRIAGE
ncbi:MAG TPA: GAF domain-containing protein, partial [Herpetosiphonaceae bacterium]|nr:GAF domain-containing protein [Herpetosiphonaceae bacterium]